MRYNTDGSLDTDFDGDGIVTINPDIGYSSRSSVTVQANGKILLGGGNSDPNFALMRYNTDGSLDTGFDGDGKVTTSDVGSIYEGQPVAVQADGKILLAGNGTHLDGGSGWSVAVRRYNTDGSLDTSFDVDGKVTTIVGNMADGRSVTVQADGKILLGGKDYYGFVLVRYNSDGSLDTGFDGDGIVHTPGGYGGYSVTVQADGKILLSGYSGGNFALVRYNSDGSLDTSFDPVNTLNDTPAYTENSTAAVLDKTVQINDAQLTAQGHYQGASITLARHGGANSQDVFSGSGNLSFNGKDAQLSGVSIGTLSNNKGTLTLKFNSNATQARVDEALSSLAYSNTSDTPSASVQIDWTISDGNTGAQGKGGALTALGSTIVTITPTNDAPTLTAFSAPVTTGSEDSTIKVSFTDLQDRGNEADADSTVTAFAIKAINSGSLKIGASANTATPWDATINNIVDATHDVFWTPAANANGTLNAFSAVAKDSGGLESATTIQAKVAVTPVNDAPVLKTPAAINYTDTAFDDTFATVTGSLVAADMDSNSLTYGISGGIDKGGTISISSLYGVLTVTKASGEYSFVANDAAIEAEPFTFAVSTELTVTASDGSLTSSKKLTINATQSGTTESIGNDTLTGSSGDDKFDGLAGNDIIDGSTGADTMKGGLGNDLYIVDNAGDVVIETSTLTTEIDQVNSSISYTLRANLENLTLLERATAIEGTGNSLNNFLVGNAGANTLDGGSGDDILSGGLGKDKLIGGLGTDQFKFFSVAETGITPATQDTISDFRQNQQDKIDLSAIDANTVLAGNNAFAAPRVVVGPFWGGFANPGELVFDQSANTLYGNNDTDSMADFSIKVMGVSGLSAVDFVL